MTTVIGPGPAGPRAGTVPGTGGEDAAADVAAPRKPGGPGLAPAATGPAGCAAPVRAAATPRAAAGERAHAAARTAAAGAAAGGPAVRWHVTAARAADAPALHALFASCSAETVRLRFFGRVRALPAEYLADVLAGCPERHDAVVAYAFGASRARLAGLASLAQPPGAAAAELGVLVGDAWQRQGAGRAMLDVLLARARARGVRRVAVSVLPGRSALLGALGRHLEPEHLAHTSDGPRGVYKLDRP